MSGSFVNEYVTYEEVVISVRNYNYIPQEIGMQLLIPAWNTCFGDQAPHLLYMAVYLDDTFYNPFLSLNHFNKWYIHWMLRS